MKINATRAFNRTALRIGLGLALAGWMATRAHTAHAAGFQINEHSAVNTGMASSVVATVDDPSAIFHNPAGLTRIKGTEFQAGLNFIIPHGTYQGSGLPGNVDANNSGEYSLVTDPVPVPYVYAGRELSDKAFVGLGFYLPYGSGIRWEDEDNFVGRTQVQELALRTFFFTPSVALKLNDIISVAVGVSLVPATLQLRREVGAADNQEPLFSRSSIEISGTAFGVGANAGVQLKLIEHLNIGFTFKSAVDLSFNGDANFTVPENTPLSTRSNFPDQGGSGDITLPHTFGLGVGWVQGPLTIEAGGQLTLWESYDELRINFEDGLPSETSASPRNWENVFLVRLGVEYLFNDLALRAGGGYDQSPIPNSTADFTLTDSDRVYFSLGAGYDFGAIRADVGYMGLYLVGRDLEPNTSINIPAGGNFEGGFAHVLSVSVGVGL